MGGMRGAVRAARGERQEHVPDGKGGGRRQGRGRTDDRGGREGRRAQRIRLDGLVARRPSRQHRARGAVARSRRRCDCRRSVRVAAVNMREKIGWTALHWAAARGYGDVAALWLAAGADYTLKNDEEYTPLMLALKEGQEEVAGLLHKAGGRE